MTRLICAISLFVFHLHSSHCVALSGTGKESVIVMMKCFSWGWGRIRVGAFNSSMCSEWVKNRENNGTKVTEVVLVVAGSSNNTLETMIPVGKRSDGEFSHGTVP